MFNYDVEERMTRSLYEISADSSIEMARKIMSENSIRHLPVYEHRRLVGVISDRDIRQVQPGDDSKNTKVEELMSERLYVVPENESLKKVIREMHENKYGCTIIVDNDGWTKGIFTTIDALQLLEELLDGDEPETHRNFSTIEEYLVRCNSRPNLIPA